MQIDTNRALGGKAERERAVCRDWVGPILLLLAITGVSVVTIMTAGAGAPGSLVLVVYPPSWSEAQSVEATLRAGGPVVGFGPAHWLMVTAAETADIVPRLREEGALLLLNATAARLCGT